MKKNEQKLREKIKNEEKDLIAKLRNDLVQTISLHKPKPEIAIFVLEILKSEVTKQVIDREFIKLSSKKKLNPIMGRKNNGRSVEKISSRN